MSSTEIGFKLVGENKCPYYKKGDNFKLSGNALSLRLEKENTFISTAIVRFPHEKEPCRILIGDLTNILIQYENIDKIPSMEIECGGCSGSIQLELKREKGVGTGLAQDVPSKNIEIAAHLLSNFSIFETLDEYNLRNIVALLKIRKYPKGAIILKKGAPAQNLYIVLSGAVEVLDENDVCLSILRKGDVFGEMSLISGNPVAATIKVVDNATVVFLEGKEFKDVLNRFPSVQMYLTRLLAKRLAESNFLRAEEIASGMTGQLSEMSATELLQALNLSQKTGVLTLTLPKGSAELFLREGDLIRAEYNNKEGKEAIYEILKEKQGRFKFKPRLPETQKDAPIIGPLMEMLLETSKIIDEETV